MSRCALLQGARWSGVRNTVAVVLRSALLVLGTSLMDLSCLLVRLRECIHFLAGIVTTRPSITRRRCQTEAQRLGELPGIFGEVRAAADGPEERWQVWTMIER